MGASSATLSMRSALDVARAAVPVGAVQGGHCFGGLDLAGEGAEGNELFGPPALPEDNDVLLLGLRHLCLSFQWNLESLSERNLFLPSFPSRNSPSFN